MTREQKEQLLYNAIKNDNIILFILKSFFPGTVPNLPEEKIDECIALITAYQQTDNFIMESAVNFGKKLMVEFGNENRQLGITQDGMTKTVRRACSEVTECLLTGSLIDAMDEIRAIPQESRDPKYLSDTRLLQFVNKIEAYIGYPISTEL